MELENINIEEITSFDEAIELVIKNNENKSIPHDFSNFKGIDNKGLNITVNIED